MTARELIEKLKFCSNQNAEVIMLTDNKEKYSLEQEIYLIEDENHSICGVISLV